MTKTPLAPRAFATFAALAVLALVPAGCSRGSGDPAADARSAMAAGDLLEARVHVANALKASPDDPALLKLQGMVAMELGDGDVAVAALRRLAEAPGAGADARELLAKAFVVQGNPKRALDVLGDGAPTTAAGHAARVGALFAQGRSDDGLAALDAGLAAFADDVDLLILDGGRQAALGNQAAASAIADRVAAAAPKRLEAMLFAGRIAMGARQFDKAQGLFNRALTLRPGNPAALLALGGIANDRGDAKAAASYFAQADQAAPGNPVAAYFLAQMAFDAGEIDRARSLLQGAGPAGASFPAALALDGIIASQRGYHDEAVKKLRTFVAAGGDDPRATLALALSLVSIDDPAQAWTVLRPLAAQANASAAVLKLAADLAARQGDAAAPRLAQRAAAAARPDPIAPQMLAADAAIRGGKWAEANKIYTALLAAGNRDNLILLNNAASVRMELGDAAAAVPLARAALALGPDDPMVMDTLAGALAKSGGDRAEALALARRAAALAPGNAAIVRTLAEIQGSAG